MRLCLKYGNAALRAQLPFEGTDKDVCHEFPGGCLFDGVMAQTGPASPAG